MERIAVTANLRTKSVLHVGSGGSKPELIAGKEGERDQEVSVALVATGINGPWIPGSTLKGALRALPMDVDVRNRLFGLAHGTNAHVAQGSVTVAGAHALEANVIQLSQTAVDSGTGVAEANKLFRKEYVDEGATFTARFWIQGAAAKGSLDDFLGLLAHFAGPEGHEVGAGKADSPGRLAIEGPVTIESRCLTGSGFSAPEVETRTLETRKSHKPFDRMTLHCTGPYLLRGGVQKVQDSRDPSTEREVMIALRSRNDQPRQTGTGLSGALRARAEWLLALSEHRKDGRLARNPVPRRTSQGQNQPLDVVQRLFGYTGYRGSLKLRVDKVRRTGPSTHRSVALDPVSQKPFEGALFAIDADHGVSISFSLVTWRAFERDEQDLVDALLEDIRENGLRLGAGGSKGFGWFSEAPDAPQDVSVTAAPPAVNVLFADRLPDPAVTLPYRMITVNLDKVGLPQDQVLKAWRNRSLHSTPLEGGLCGCLDATWCFETPILVGDGGNPSGPVAIGNRYVLPGSTLRGAMRSIVATMTGGRLDRVNPVVKPGALKTEVDDLLGSPAHNPAGDSDFEPDFTQALFGFIKEPAGGATDSEVHARLHLKSRLSFGFAWLINEDNLRRRNDVYSLVLGSPNTDSLLYDRIGRKTYPADNAVPERVVSRLSGMAPRDRERDSVSSLRFLHPRQRDTLRFRGRIRFHNVTPAELGALVWAVTLGGDIGRRHRIGHAKAFGAGRCFASGIHLRLSPNDGTEATRASDEDKGWFGLAGATPLSAYNAFVAYLNANGLPGQQIEDELIAAATPSVGQAIKGEDCMGYQTWSELGEEKAEAIRDEHDGRLAAMLKSNPRK